MMQSVFVLERETFWNDIDHTEWYDLVGLFVDEKLAKRCAQEIYEKENNNAVFDSLQWVNKRSDYEPERHWLVTNLEFDKYKVDAGNFRIEEHPLHGY